LITFDSLSLFVCSQKDINMFATAFLLCLLSVCGFATASKHQLRKRKLIQSSSRKLQVVDSPHSFLIFFLTNMLFISSQDSCAVFTSATFYDLESGLFEFDFDSPQTFDHYYFATNASLLVPGNLYSWTFYGSAAGNLFTFLCILVFL